ncbi:hypothetical protein A5789_26660 [Nocardia sp. 852002-51101_SCH5132738]|nr:hypothetical protein A5789_26660 [Nocardia sp. 852002-51101_SCH5132738]OBB37516.1 hypothetical protein A5748_03585 [Nocardia sp. 852002-51244_SCH5132740]OBF86826.1 hypothetical protein A9X06_12020 [Mycobacterium sp. 852002-51759_SCH5129042]
MPATVARPVLLNSHADLAQQRHVVEYRTSPSDLPLADRVQAELGVLHRPVGRRDAAQFRGMGAADRDVGPDPVVLGDQLVHGEGGIGKRAEVVEQERAVVLHGEIGATGAGGEGREGAIRREAVPDCRQIPGRGVADLHESANDILVRFDRHIQPSH